jgi:hypothetical protein
MDKAKSKKVSSEASERIHSIISNERKLTNPKFTTVDDITKIMGLPTRSDAISNAKFAVLMSNPNANSEHVEMALKGTDSPLVLSAILCPKATDEQLNRGIRLLIDVGEFKSIQELKKEMEEYLEDWKKSIVGKRSEVQQIERLIKTLDLYDSGNQKESLGARAKKRIEND